MLNTLTGFHDLRSKRKDNLISYDVFLSHSTRLDPDHHEAVDELASALQRRGLRVFWDRDAFEGGEELLSALEEAIEASRVGLLVLTSAALTSPWVEFEREIMHRRKLSQCMQVLALKLETGCTVPPDIEPADVITPDNLRILTVLADQVEAAVRRASRRL